tara:strand:- start:603 stop:791 length:189 start_codon:yes stop_codon:yes gene_type:complete
MLEEFINAIKFGVAKTDSDTKYIPYTPMTLRQAAAHFGKHEQTFLHHLVAYPEYKERYDLAK